MEIKRTLICDLVFVFCFAPHLGAAEGAGMKRGDAPIVVKETYHASAKDVWKAITVADEMRKSYFNTIPNFMRSDPQNCHCKPIPRDLSTVITPPVSVLDIWAWM